MLSLYRKVFLIQGITYEGQWALFPIVIQSFVYGFIIMMILQMRNNIGVGMVGKVESKVYLIGPWTHINSKD